MSNACTYDAGECIVEAAAARLGDAAAEAIAARERDRDNPLGGCTVGELRAIRGGLVELADEGIGVTEALAALDAEVDRR